MTRQDVNHHERYRFGEFTLDPASRELRNGIEVLMLSPKVFDCIAYLIEHRDRAVGRDELIAAIWDKTDVTYSLLGQLMAKVRRAVGGRGNDQDVIRTIPRFGYRWVAAIKADGETEIGQTAAALAPQTLQGSHAVGPWILTPGRRAWLLLASLAVATVGSWVYFRAHTSTPASLPLPTHQVSDAAAILPVDVKATGEWAWVRLGMMDLIGDRLRTAGQPVVPSENIVALARGDATAGIRDAVRDVTGARYVISPVASRTEKEWVVRLKLVSADGVERSVESRDADILVAARDAADSLLTLLGRSVPSPHSDALAGSDDELLARARAALLSGDLALARQILESAPEELQRSPELQRRLSQVDYRSNRPEAAGRRLDELLKEVSAETDPQLRATLLNDSGIAALSLDQPAAGESKFTEALKLLASSSNPAELGRAHLGRGIAYEMEGDYDRFGAELSLARVAYSVAGDAGALASVEWNEGELDIRYNHYAAAKPILESAAERFERLGRRSELFLAQASKIKVALALLDSSAALAVIQQALPRLGDLQSPVALHYFQILWARSLIVVGRFAEARALLDQWSRDTESQERDPPFLAELDTQRASLDVATGHPEPALVGAKRAVDVLSLPDYARDRLQAWLIAIRALRDLHRSAEASAETRQFSAWARAPSNHAIAPYAKMAEAEQAESEGRKEAALHLYESALQEVVIQGVPADIAEVVGSYGSALLADGDLDRASSVIGQVVRFADQDFNCAVLQARLYRALGQREVWQVNLQRARDLAGERGIPPDIVGPSLTASVH